MLDWEIPPLVHYPPIEEQRVYRTGAEEEYSSKGRIGTHDKIEDKKEKLLPKTLTYKFDIPPYQLLLPHNTLRPYERLIPITEIDADYQLNPNQFTLQDELDPNESDIPTQVDTSRSTQASVNYLNEVLEHDYLSKIPGLNSSHITKQLQIEISYYLRTKLELPPDCGNIQNVDYGFSIFKGEPDYEDHISDDEVEVKEIKSFGFQGGQGKEKKVSKFKEWKEKKVQQVDQFLKYLEEDDEELIKLKQAQLEEKEIFDELEDTQTNVSIGIKAEKYKWVATIPSKTNEYNRFIYDNNLKLYI